MEHLRVVAPRDEDWSLISTRALLEELAKRDDDDSRPQCGSGEKGSYNTMLHLLAVVIILSVSTISCAAPLFFRRRSGAGRSQSSFIFYCQHFGAGVLLSTAFVHLLPTAFNSLTDPCLPTFFSKRYTPLAGLIAMILALGVLGLESYLTTIGAGHSQTHHHGGDDDGGEEGRADHAYSAVSSFAARRGSIRRPNNIAMDDMTASEGLLAGVSPLPGSTPTDPAMQKGAADHHQHQHSGPRATSQDDDDDDDDDRESLDLELPELADDGHSGDGAALLARTASGKAGSLGMSQPPAAAAASPGRAPLDEQQKLIYQCVLLECGILFHSIFIGMALSVAVGPSFVVFLLAIAFHQGFEGLALGSRIAALQFPKSSVKPWLMVLAFGFTTPFGQIIGLGVHNFYDPMSQTGLIMVGIMNAISSGLLLFAGLVQLLAEDFLSEKSCQTLQGTRRWRAYFAVVCGSAMMAAVGAFA